MCACGRRVINHVRTGRMNVAKLLLLKSKEPDVLPSEPMDLESDNIPADIFERVCPFEPVPSPVLINENTLEDVQLSEWCRKQPCTMGGSDLFYKMVSQPTTHTGLLRSRQDMVRRARSQWSEEMKELSSLEKGVLWIYTLPDTMENAWPLPLLFPSVPLLRRLNLSSRGLGMFHMYRIWLTPIFQIVMPIMSILGPWFYLRLRMGWKLSLGQYFMLMKFLIAQSMAGAEWHEKVMRIVMMLVYSFMFIYGIIQTIEVSRMLLRVKQQMIERVRGIQEFVARAHALVSKWDKRSVSMPVIPDGMVGVHALWLDKSLRESLLSLMKRLYELDVSLACRRLVDREKWTFVRYMPPGSHHACHGMRCPVLPGKQTSNPMCLNKNIIVTGPNAAGKSTYVRSIGANIILSQTLGISCSRGMQASPVSAILSYMRVRDVVGSGSLFETEVRHCSGIIAAATEIQESGGTAVILFDEPMHSTPPLEGESAAYAVLEHLGSLSNIRTVVTSHYHRLTTLPEDRWRNVSMDATKTPSGTYVFPYRLQPGPSFQSIAIELLRGTDMLPEAVVQKALKFKSSLCKQP